MGMQGSQIDVFRHHFQQAEIFLASGVMQCCGREVLLTGGQFVTGRGVPERSHPTRPQNERQP